MLNIEKTIRNLIGISYNPVELKDFIADVVCAFDTTDKYVIVEPESFQAYEDEADSPIIRFEIRDGKIVDAWEV